MIQEHCDKDPEIKKAHERSKPLFEINQVIIELQIKENLSQRQLAKRLKLTKKELDSIQTDEDNITVDLLYRVAHSLGREVKIRFV